MLVQILFLSETTQKTRTIFEHYKTFFLTNPPHTLLLLLLWLLLLVFLTLLLHCEMLLQIVCQKQQNDFLDSCPIMFETRSKLIGKTYEK